MQRLASGDVMLEGEGRSLPGYGRPDTGDEGRSPAVQQRDDAMRTLDRHVKSGSLPARAAETVENLTRSGSGAGTVMDRAQRRGDRQ